MLRSPGALTPSRMMLARLLITVFWVIITPRGKRVLPDVY
jgi:hypothetical protein